MIEISGDWSDLKVRTAKETNETPPKWRKIDFTRQSERQSKCCPRLVDLPRKMKAPTGLLFASFADLTQFQGSLHATELGSGMIKQRFHFFGLTKIGHTELGRGQQSGPDSRTGVPVGSRKEVGRNDHEV